MKENTLIKVNKQNLLSKQSLINKLNRSKEQNLQLNFLFVWIDIEVLRNSLLVVKTPVDKKPKPNELMKQLILEFMRSFKFHINRTEKQDVISIFECIKPADWSYNIDIKSLANYILFNDYNNLQVVTNKVSISTIDKLIITIYKPFDYSRAKYQLVVRRLYNILLFLNFYAKHEDDKNIEDKYKENHHIILFELLPQNIVWALIKLKNKLKYESYEKTN